MLTFVARDFSAIAWISEYYIQLEVEIAAVKSPIALQRQTTALLTLQ
ncbi:hypothetical protein [Microcoleus sp. AT3-D2]